MLRADNFRRSVPTIHSLSTPRAPRSRNTGPVSFSCIHVLLMVVVPVITMSSACVMQPL
jgi:hypothetical protein